MSAVGRERFEMYSSLDCVGEVGIVVNALCTENCTTNKHQHTSGTKHTINKRPTLH